MSGVQWFGAALISAGLLAAVMTDEPGYFAVSLIAGMMLMGAC